MPDDEKKEFSDTVNKMLGLEGTKAVDFTKLSMMELMNTYTAIERVWSSGSKKRGSSKSVSTSPMDGIMSMDTVKMFVENMTENQSQFVEEAIEKRRAGLSSFPLLERGIQMFDERRKGMKGGGEEQKGEQDKQ